MKYTYAQVSSSLISPRVSIFGPLLQRERKREPSSHRRSIIGAPHIYEAPLDNEPTDAAKNSCVCVCIYITHFRYRARANRIARRSRKVFCLWLLKRRATVPSRSRETAIWNRVLEAPGWSDDPQLDQVYRCGLREREMDSLQCFLYNIDCLVVEQNNKNRKRFL